MYLPAKMLRFVITREAGLACHYNHLDVYLLVLFTARVRFQTPGR